MTSAEAWRKYAERLLAQATDAQSDGDPELAEMLTALAMRYLDEAAEIDASESRARGEGGREAAGMGARPPADEKPGDPWGGARGPPQLKKNPRRCGGAVPPGLGAWWALESRYGSPHPPSYRARGDPSPEHDVN